MKKYLISSALTIMCSMSASAITTDQYANLFKGYHACFMLYDATNHKMITEYNPNNRCQQRISPNSTFKLALSLMAFNQGTINQDTVFKWDGHKNGIPEHDGDQTPASWIKYSVVWVSQQITPQLGMPRIKRYLAGFNYGNQDFSGDQDKDNGLTHAWLSSSLKISAKEQLDFLKAMLGNELAIHPNAVNVTKENLYLGTLDNGAAYYGKTGSGRHGHNEREVNPSLLRDGWFVGFIEQDSHQYIFVSNLTDKQFQASFDPIDGSLKPYGSQLLKPITMKILNRYFAK